MLVILAGSFTSIPPGDIVWRAIDADAGDFESLKVPVFRADLLTHRLHSSLRRLHGIRAHFFSHMLDRKFFVVK